jgi:hypothetical protein
MIHSTVFYHIPYMMEVQGIEIIWFLIFEVLYLNNLDKLMKSLLLLDIFILEFIYLDLWIYGIMDFLWNFAI